MTVAGCGVAFAQDADGVMVPGMTSKSPLYIFDRLGDWARLNLFTFNAVRKVEVRSQIAEERLAELKSIVEGGADSAATTRAETLYRTHVEAVSERLKTLDDAGRDVGELAERFNGLTLRHQEVLGHVLEKAPEPARDAIKKSLDASGAGLTRATEVVAHQLEKGNLTKEQAQEIIEHSTDQLKKQVESASRDLIALKARQGTVSVAEKELLEARIRGLENFLARLHSQSELKDVRQATRLDVSNAAQKVLEARQSQGIRDTASEDSLRAIQNQQFDPETRARRMIAAATELMAQLERKIKEAETAKKEVPERVMAHARIAHEHLEKAKMAFDAKDFGEAFGQANSAIQNIKAALSYFDSLVRTPANTDGRICAEVITPARNTATKECKVFPNACLSDGWIPDRSCVAGEIPRDLQNIFPQAVPKPIGEAPVIQGTWNIKITDEGFFPRELTIKEGDAVIWINGGSRPHWPASGMHPTHAFYPEKGGCIGSMFDACRGLETDEKFEFKFNQVGAWKYHDHLNAGLGGAIIVVSR